MPAWVGAHNLQSREVSTHLDSQEALFPNCDIRPPVYYILIHWTLVPERVRVSPVSNLGTIRLML